MRALFEQASSRRGVVEAALLLLVTPYVWLLWSVEFPMMQDLGGHLEIGYLYGLVNDGGSSTYVAQSAPWPNTLGPWALSHLGPLLGYLTAAKLLLTLYLLTWPLTVSLVARALDRSPWLAILAIPAALDANWAFGFFNYILAKPLLMLSLYAAIRLARGPDEEQSDLPLWKRRRIRWGAALTALLILTFLTHALVWLVTMAGCGFALLVFSSGWKRLTHQLPLVLVAPIMLPYQLTAGGRDGRWSWNNPEHAFDTLWEDFAHLNTGHGEEWAFATLFALWLCLMALPSRPRFSTQAFLLSSIVVLFLGYMFGPRHITGVDVIVQRQLFLVWTFMMLLPATTLAFPHRLFLFLGGAIAILPHVHLTHANYVAFNTHDMGDFSQLLEQIPPGATLAVAYTRQFRGRSAYGDHAPLWHWPKLHHVRHGGRTSDSFAFRPYSTITLSPEARARGLDLQEYRWVVRSDGTHLGGWDYQLKRGFADDPPPLEQHHEALIGQTGHWYLFKLREELSSAGSTHPPELVGREHGVHARWHCPQDAYLRAFRIRVAPGSSGIELMCGDAWGLPIGHLDTRARVRLLTCPHGASPQGLSATDDLARLTLHCSDAPLPKDALSCPPDRTWTGIEARVDDHTVVALGLVCQ